MDIVRLFTREEQIGGLEISEGNLRLVVLQLSGKEKKVVSIVATREKELEPGVIENGELKDPAAFKKNLSKLVAELGGKLKCVILSLPAQIAYTKVFSFPPNFDDEKIAEAMKLTTGFQLPHNPRDVYVSWQKMGTEKAAYLSAAPKKIIDSYINALSACGLTPIAAEFHSLSALRAMSGSEAPFLVIIVGREGATTAIAHNGFIRFSRFLPFSIFKKPAELSGEIRKILDFYQAENKISVAEIKCLGDKSKLDAKSLPLPLSDFESPDELKVRFADSGGPQNWLIALGAGQRGLIPRSEDTMVSLLPIGTAAAYENRKAIVFARFLSNIIIAVSVFLTLTFIGVWILASRVNQNLSARMNQLKTLPAPADAASLQARAESFNALVGRANGLISRSPVWSKFLEEFSPLVTPGVTITSLDAATPNDLISVAGTAKDRVALSAFRQSLESASILSGAAMPRTSLTQRENIPFTVSFRLRNPGQYFQ